MQNKTDNFTIGLMGLNFYSANLGCGALAYAFRSLLVNCLAELEYTARLIIYTSEDDALLQPCGVTGITEKIVRFQFSDGLQTLGMLKHELSQCDLVFDFTEGDSFADIYGIKRFVKTSLLKRFAIRYSGGLVLGPQTYGPFNNRLVQMAAKRLVSESAAVFARDEQSADIVRSFGRSDVKTTTDVAFALPKVSCSLPFTSQKRFGLNVSGLLYSGGYTRNNQFDLTVNYIDYIDRLIPALQKEGYEVHLIPHVIGGPDELDSDTGICARLAEQYEGTVLTPQFKTPMEAKGYIAQMDIFSGARMHATIGAFSSGVSTIPFSYSRKFEGLYESLGYRYWIDGKTLSTDEALARTLELARNRDQMICDQDVALARAQQRIAFFKDELVRLLVTQR